MKKEHNYAHQLSNMPKLILLVGMVQVSLILSCHLLVYKMVNLHGWTLSASTLLFPLTYFFGDVIAEVYGYKISRQLIWFSFIAMFIFDMVPALLVNLPSSSSWHHQLDYDYVVGQLPRTFIGDFIAINVGQFLNVYILDKMESDC